MPLYFAYGANMDAAAMARRCPVSRLIGLGHLPHHRFIVMREGYASVVRDPSRTVHGVLWELALDDIPALDRYEGVAGGLYAKATLPVHTGEGVRRALIYLGRSTAPGRPRPGYLEAVLAAAAAAPLPAPYIREVGGWRRGPPV
ncbi:gamma-glutamylcyclotransferase family protein [Methylobacterium sp. J-076]|uniref:gamma-glutamylcyclotransferase family protein n=1 Tax=Methylobacterium sp. J-076 TaxID=2836655 RepID=UPI001FBBCBBB|nr:gamma-glutamylcyclotransferase family protein [Methylobacterium sp. J-076]MCJ2013441.1 gamma-glutamylcyclotransferase [Methylobacterium sp. J-076]